tara:strand:- start:402 stop:911 length:510 start_codon:yes stop_codon:yes gene_type:complete
MDENLEKKVELKDKIISFINTNRLKFIVALSILIISVIAMILNDFNSKKRNSIAAEKYIKAGIFLTKNDKENSRKLYEEIITSKNKFYSLLALNVILEKDLVSSKEKILDYFKIIEKLKYPKETIDLISFKKALFLIKNSDVEAGNNLIQKLIQENSNLKSLSEEIINK